MKFTTFKPKQAGGGSAVSFNINDGNLWITVWPQEGTGKAFDWSKRTFATLNENEAGEMLAVIEGRIDGCGKADDRGDKGIFYGGFFHQSDGGTAQIKFSRFKDLIMVGLSTDRGEFKHDYKCSLTIGEAYVVREMLRGFIRDRLEVNNTFVKDGGVTGGESTPATNAPAPSTSPATAPSKGSGKPASGGKGKTQKVVEGPTAALGADDDIPF